MTPILALLLALPCAPQSGPTDAPLAIVDVTVLPMDAERRLEHHTVLVEDGRITAVGPAGELAAPEGARVVDGTGLTLIPGLIDTHVHVNETEEDFLFAWLAGGVTTVQSMHGTPHTLDLRREIAAGERLGPRILTTGPTTAREGVHSVEEAREHVRRVVADEYDAVKMYGDGSDTMPLETYRALVSATHEAGLRVTGHAPRNLPFDVVLDAGQDSIDHAEEIVYTHAGFADLLGPWVEFQFGRRSPAALGPDPVPPDVTALADEVDALAVRMRERGLALTPTLVTFSTIQRMAAGDLDELLAQPRIRLAHPVYRGRWTNDGNRFRRPDVPDLLGAWFARELELQRMIVAACDRHDVPLMTGTDSPFDLVLPGTSLQDEVEELVRCGLTPYRALRAATATPARELGIDEEAGTIEAGKRADLVLLRANPLEDVAALRSIAGVVAAGRWLPAEELERGIAAHMERNDAAIDILAELRAALEAADVEGAFELLDGFGDDAILSAFVEREVNAVGYAHLRAGRVDEAMSVFEANVERFPDSWNVWDSFAEATLATGDTVLARQLYEHSLELNPGNSNARQALERIGE